MSAPLGLFEGFGVELEYMLVRTPELDVLPATDTVIAAEAGEIVSEIEVGDLCWSNELVLHVIELKTNGPAPRLEGLAERFHDSVQRINAILAGHAGRLLPTAMHPWMDPLTETRLWPHEFSPIYEAYNRIFDCRGHGWSNLQSVHLNLPFRGEDEFARLHAAIRLVLPILPALAAASPIAGGRLTGFLDTRMEAYRTNSSKIHSVAGDVIPEPVFTESEYRREIFERMYRDIAPHDPDGVLQDEFLNARGAIARFDRSSIEIRVTDSQECARQDVAVAAATVAVLRGLTDERDAPLAEQKRWGVAPLAEIFRACIRDADETLITDPEYLKLFGMRAAATPAKALWKHLVERALHEETLAAEWEEGLAAIHGKGTLARRIADAAGPEPDRGELRAVYETLGECLASNQIFSGKA